MYTVAHKDTKNLLVKGSCIHVWCALLTYTTGSIGTFSSSNDTSRNLHSHRVWVSNTIRWEGITTGVISTVEHQRIVEHHLISRSWNDHYPEVSFCIHNLQNTLSGLRILSLHWAWTYVHVRFTLHFRKLTYFLPVDINSLYLTISAVHIVVSTCCSDSW